jgi:hypothetical protein
VPAFADAPLAEAPADLEGAGAVVLGIPHEGRAVLDPETYAPPRARPRSGARPRSARCVTAGASCPRPTGLW